MKISCIATNEEAEFFKNKVETPYTTFLTRAFDFGYYFLICPFRLVVRKNPDAFEVVAHHNMAQKV